MRLLSLLLAVSLLAAACGSGEPACRVGADCASGVCLGDGTCSVDSTEEPTAPPPAWLEPTTPPYQPGAQASLACAPNLDRRITADEMRPAIGIPVTYLVSGRGSIDVAGQAASGGTRSWNWSQAIASAEAVDFAAAALSAKWYAGYFPGAKFSLAMDAEGLLDAVYSSDSEALWLHGLVSVSSNPLTRTLLVYDRPVAVFRFPLAPGGTWTSSGKVTGGLINGMPYAGEDTYEVRVDGSGSLALPDLSFPQVLRVRTKVTSDPSAGMAIVRHQVSLIAECFGEVARAVSLDNETREDFTTAAQVRRIGL